MSVGSALILAGCGGSSSEDPSPAPTLASAVLLPAQDMPAWNGAIVWSAQELPDDAALLEICVLPTPESLGAIDVVQQDYLASSELEPGMSPDPQSVSDPMVGRNVVALFPGESQATAAVVSLETAMQDCDADAVQISDLPSGSTWTVGTPTPTADVPEWMRFDFVGFAASGAYVTSVGFSLSGQDANSEGDPLADSMEASLARLP